MVLLLLNALHGGYKGTAINKVDPVRQDGKLWSPDTSVVLNSVQISLLALKISSYVTREYMQSLLLPN